MTKIINLFAGPSGGKSTTAAGVFHFLKNERYNVEYVSEFAKDLVWDNSLEVLDDQLYVLAEQHHRIYRLLGKVDWIVTDSPIIMSAICFNNSFKKYTDYKNFLKSDFISLVFELHYRQDNYNYFVERGKRKFIQAGRIQNEKESIQKDKEILALLDENIIEYKKISSFTEIIEDLKI